MSVDHIRNVAIIAHVDHGKTTLVDCLLRQSETLGERELLPREGSKKLCTAAKGTPGPEVANIQRSLTRDGPRGMRMRPPKASTDKPKISREDSNPPAGARSL